MIRSATDMPKGLRALTLLLYWGSITIGVLLPWAMQLAVDVLHRHRPPAEFLDGFTLRLFGADGGLLFLTGLGATPFFVYAVLALFHLGLAPRRGALIARRRRLALLLAAAAMTGVAIAGHVAILTARGSTAALGFLFLPFYVLLAAGIGYGLGRWIGMLRYRGEG